MLKDALAYLADLATKSVAPQLVKLPGNKVAFHIPGREADILDGDRDNRKDTVSTLNSFELWIRDIGTDRDIDIWVRGEQLVAECDACEPHLVDKLRMHLVESAQMKQLREFGKGVGQVAFVRHLRSLLAESYDEKLLPIFRALDFKRLDQTARDVRHTRESLGRSIELEAQSRNGEIPEKMRFQIPVWDFISSPVCTVDLAVEIDNPGERIILLPVADAFTAAIQSAQLELQQRLAAEFKDEPTVRVFVG